MSWVSLRSCRMLVSVTYASGNGKLAVSPPGFFEACVWFGFVPGAC